jgi:hypothetical protein
MIPRSALQQALARLKAAACPYRFRERRGSPFLTVYETCKGGSTATARNYRAENDADIEELTTILLAAQASLRQGGPGLDWQLLSGAPSTSAGVRTPRQTWGEICSLITADIAPGGQKARDPNPFFTSSSLPPSTSPTRRLPSPTSGARSWWRRFAASPTAATVCSWSQSRTCLASSGTCASRSLTPSSGSTSRLPPCRPFPLRDERPGVEPSPLRPTPGAQAAICS